MTSQAAEGCTESEGDRDEAVIEAVLAEAHRVGWENVQLRRVAAALGMSLVELTDRFRDKDAVADAWFTSARRAMLADLGEDFAARPARERLEILFMRWFDALAPHRRVAIAALKTKAWPVHVHHWVPMLFHLSRLIILIRDAAGLEAGGARGAIEEVTLTWLFVATLAVWATDGTPGQERTRAFLRNRLIDADSGVCLVYGKPHRPLADAAGTTASR
jgi:AcrR family transcriptional regulator